MGLYKNVGLQDLTPLCFRSGLSKLKTLLYNLLSSLSMIIGAVVAYYALSTAQGFVPFVLAVAASSFIYIAMADLIPGLHKKTEMRATVEQVVLILIGIGAIFAVHSMMH